MVYKTHVLCLTRKEPILSFQQRFEWLVISTFIINSLQKLINMKERGMHANAICVQICWCRRRVRIQKKLRWAWKPWYFPFCREIRLIKHEGEMAETTNIKLLPSEIQASKTSLSSAASSLMLWADRTTCFSSAGRWYVQTMLREQCLTEMNWSTERPSRASKSTPAKKPFNSDRPKG